MFDINYEALDEAIMLLESTIYGRPEAKLNKNKLDTDNLQNMRKKLVRCAKSNMFNNKDYSNWSNYPVDNNEVKELAAYKLGYCWADEGDNFFVYSIKTDRFYFFNHELTGLENINEYGPISLEYIKKSVDEFNARYFKENQ